MSLRPSFRVACRALAMRSRPALPRHETLTWSLQNRRYADDATPKPPSAQQASSTIPGTQTKSENPGDVSDARMEQQRKAMEELVSQTSPEDVMDQLEAALRDLPAGEEAPTVEVDALAEEAAADTSGITVEEAMSQLEKAAQADKSSKGLEGGLTPAQEEHLYREGSIPPVIADGQDAQRDLAVLANGGVLMDAVEADQHMQARSHKFPLPTLPLGPQSKLRERYHPVLDQLTNLLMRHGKKSVAQRNMAMILNFLRTSPPPILSKKHRLLAGHPPASHLPLNPLLYLTLIIDSVAPLVRVTYLKGGAGGGRALEVPGPLAVRQRRRTAFQWILDVVNKKRSSGSGRTQLAQRIASEIVAVAEGRSTVWDKRLTVHKLATASRVNVNPPRVKGGKLRS